MNISPELRDKLVLEIRYAAENMKKSERISDKIYFFSAVYGMADRSFNFEYDPELIFIYQVVRQAFDNINAKINLMSQVGPSIGTSIPGNLFPRLETILGELVVKIEKNESTHLLLQDIANIGYSATGNGSYLAHKGVLKI